MNIQTQFVRTLTNFRGIKINRKIVVIESDDWGSIRMPSRNIYEKCLKAGYPVDLNPFERYDSLANENDLNMLFDLLSTFRDKNRNHPVITANCVVANPDFQRIRANNFEQYYFELITETFKRYPNHSRNFEIWLNAKSDGLFFPQYHAREHINVSKFMNALQNYDLDMLFAFGNEMPGSIRKGKVESGNYFVEATHFTDEKDKVEKLDIYLNGLEIFDKLFGYKSESIIPTNYIWSNEFNEFTSKEGVKYIQGVYKMKDPNFGKPRILNRYLGKQNKYNQIDLVRNCFFEPSISKHDVVNSCLNEIKIAFLLKKPAIICSHRLNYVGNIDSTNRDKNLKYLNDLFKAILKKWPDVEFMNSQTIGELIKNENSRTSY